jgi:hypothetical protein
MGESDHHDFKPIIAEIEERPVNPLGMLFLWIIISLMLITLLGLFFLKIDVVVSARGKVIPVGDVKIVQPLETGVITKIHVKEGDHVRKVTSFSKLILQWIQPTSKEKKGISNIRKCRLLESMLCLQKKIMLPKGKGIRRK